MVTPMVAIVGRPNVGKSTFFNKVVGRPLSIVNDTPGSRATGFTPMSSGKAGYLR